MWYQPCIAWWLPHVKGFIGEDVLLNFSFILCCNNTYMDALKITLPCHQFSILSYFPYLTFPILSKFQLDLLYPNYINSHTIVILFLDLMETLPFASSFFVDALYFPLDFQNHSLELSSIFNPHKTYLESHFPTSIFIILYLLTYYAYNWPF